MTNKKAAGKKMKVTVKSRATKKVLLAAKKAGATTPIKAMLRSAGRAAQVKVSAKSKTARPVRKTVKRTMNKKSRTSKTVRMVRKQREAGKEPSLRLTPQEANHIPITEYRPLPGQTEPGPFAPVLPRKEHRALLGKLFVRVVSGDDRNGVGVIVWASPTVEPAYPLRTTKVRFAGGTALTPAAVVEVI